MDRFCSFLKSSLVFRSAVIDNVIFRLHYKLTFAILLALSIAVGWRQQFGIVINCLVSDSISEKFANDYCYVHPVYIIKEALNKTVGVDIPYAGVDKSDHGSTKIYINYYPWVGIVLFLQAVLSLVPSCYWKHMESGRIHEIVKGMANRDASKDDLRKQSLLFCLELGQNWKYFAFYVLAEILNLVNVIGQICLMDVFLEGRFLSYGREMIQFSKHHLPTFPGMAKCAIYRYGRSGDVQKHDALCLLPINFLNEKIYAFLWFWFLFLALVSCLPLLCRLVFCLSSRFRVSSLMSGKRLIVRKNMTLVVSQISAADCFLVHLVSQNVNSATFRDLVDNLAKEDLNIKCSEETTLM